MNTSKFFKASLVLACATFLSACGGGGDGEGTSTLPYEISVRTDKSLLPLNVSGHGPTATSGFDPVYTATLYISASSGGKPVAGSSGTSGQFGCNVSAGLNVGTLYYTDVGSGHADASGNPQGFQSITIGPNSGGAEVYFYAGSEAGTATVTCTIVEPTSGLARSSSVNIVVGGSAGGATAMPANISFHTQAPGYLGTQGNLSNLPSSVAIQAVITDDSNQNVPNPSANNLQVSIVPTGSAWSGARLVSGNASGQSLQISTVGGVGQLALISGATPGVIVLRMETDRSDNNVANGIQQSVVRYVAVQAFSSIGQAALSLPAVSVPVTALQSVVYPLQADGGVGPFTWSVQPGTLPAGLSIDSQTGLITGMTNVAPGSYIVPVTVTDQNGASATGNITITVGASTLTPLAITAPAVTAAVGQQIGVALSGSGGTAPYTYQALSALPAGLSLGSNGVLSGVPSGPAGTYTVPVQITDSGAGAARQTATVNLSITVTDTPLTVPALTAAGTVGTQFGYAIIPSGVAPYTVAALSALPAGLTLDGNTGVISGTPTGPAGTFVVPVRVSDARGRTVTTNMTITIS